MSEKAANYVETEQKFLPLFPEKLERFRADAKEIEQIYLSHPEEEYNLRIRKKIGSTVTYMATLKNKGVITNEGIRRLEVSSPINAERYDSYGTADLPRINKLRAEPHEDIVIDFFHDGHIHVESEDPAAWQQFTEQNGFENDFVEVTGDRIVDNEWRAHYDHRRRNRGREALKPADDLKADDIVSRILNKRDGSPLTVTVAGRSGSGKTTLLREVRGLLEAHGITTSIISIDDYIRGKDELHALGGGSWINYDANEAYDTVLCLEHVDTLRSGVAVPRRAYDFKTGNPYENGTISPAEVVLVEGIKAHHPDFRDVADLSFTMTTPFATAVGRRILRDLDHRPRFKPSENLAYYLEYVEPEYRALL